MDCIFKNLQNTCDGCAFDDNGKCNLQEVKEKQKETTLKDVLGDPAELGGMNG